MECEIEASLSEVRLRLMIGDEEGAILILMVDESKRRDSPAITTCCPARSRLILVLVSSCASGVSRFKMIKFPIC